MTVDDAYRITDLDPPEHGQITEVAVEGRDLIVWKTDKGKLCAMDARCPHQWTHLAYEGVIVGEEIVCMTHFWRFSTTGEGCKENIKGRRDPKGSIEVFPCREKEGKIWIAMEGEGEQ